MTLWSRLLAMLRSNNHQPPEYKTPRELDLMRESGIIVARALKICRDMAKVGCKTIDIDRAVEAYYDSLKAEPLFKNYPGRVPFPAVTCLSVNEQVVHGVPNNRELKDGDLLKIDTACRYNGWCADRAVTLLIGNVRPERARMVKVAYETLQIAIDELGRRKWWSEIASRMQRHVEQNGFACVENYVGHGIGRIMHESPQVPNYVSRETRKGDFKILPGLVLAIEPMVNMAKSECVTMRDHWTVVTKDGLPSVHVEHTVAVTENGPRVLTADEGALEGWDWPPKEPVVDTANQ
jgi:methionyl aminopeptidase